MGCLRRPNTDCGSAKSSQPLSSEHGYNASPRRRPWKLALPGQGVLLLTFILAASNGGNILGTYMKKNMDNEMEAGLTSGTNTNFCCWLLAGS